MKYKISNTEGPHSVFTEKRDLGENGGINSFFNSIDYLFKKNSKATCIAALHTNPSLMGFQCGRNVEGQDNLLTVLCMEGWKR